MPGGSKRTLGVIAEEEEKIETSARETPQQPKAQKEIQPASKAPKETVEFNREDLKKPGSGAKGTDATFAKPKLEEEEKMKQPEEKRKEASGTNSM